MKRSKPNFTPNERNRKPQGIDSLLNYALGAPQLKKKVEQYAVFPHWEEIVGKDIAAVAVPEKIIRGKILKVRVEDAVWIQELTMRKPAILDSLHRFGAGAVIEDIRFSAANPKSFSK